jgi:hypothetical protein
MMVDKNLKYYKIPISNLESEITDWLISHSAKFWRYHEDLVFALDLENGFLFNIIFSERFAQ